VTLRKSRNSEQVFSQSYGFTGFVSAKDVVNGS